MSLYNDIWYTSDGVDWKKTTFPPLFGPRALISGTVMLNNDWYIIGGALLSYNLQYNDVWKSANGINWTLVTEDAGWTPKRWITTAAFDNKLWVVGGDAYPFTKMYTNEVWSSADGVTWTRQKGVFWEPRHACFVLEFNGKLWMTGGAAYNNDGVGDVTNEVWVMEK